jgi:hypothetical protein
MAPPSDGGPTLRRPTSPQHHIPHPRHARLPLPTSPPHTLRGSTALPLCSALLIAGSQRERAGSRGRALRTYLQGSTHRIGLGGALSGPVVRSAAEDTTLAPRISMGENARGPEDNGQHIFAQFNNR